LLRSAEIFHYIKHAESYGLSVANPKFDISKIVARSRAVSKQLAGGVAMLLKKNKVTMFEGSATLLGYRYFYIY